MVLVHHRQLPAASSRDGEMVIWVYGFPSRWWSLAKTKTTIQVESRLLEQFRGLAASKHGGSRALSSELEEAIRAFSPQEVIRSLATRLGLKIDRYPSLEEVARDRPRVNVSAAEVLRELRDHRVESLP